MRNNLHSIKSIIQTVDLADKLYFDKTSAGTIVEATGDCPSGEKNLVFKAISKLREISDFGGVKVSIEKNIPSGSGLGGASSNAAAALKAVNRLYGLRIDDNALLDIAGNLGSDVPALFVGGCTYVRGTGEIVDKAESPLSNELIVIVKPEFSISTKEAYDGLDNMPDRPNIDFYLNDLQFENIRNDFESWALYNYERLADIRAIALRFEPLAACLTGSGSAYFAIFRSIDRANCFKESILSEEYISDAFVVRPLDKGMQFLDSSNS